MAYPNAVFSAFAFIGFLLCVIPYPWHLTSWNTGACLYMVWTGLGCLNQFINSVVWNHNVVNWSPIWCDISSKFIIGNSVAIPTASLCICRRIYLISSLKSFTISKAETRRNITVDLSIGVGIPVLVMTLHYIVQGHRFNIFEDVGCITSTYDTWPAFVIVSAPPVAIGLVSAIYAILNIKQFYKIRNRIKAELSNNGITPTLYVRFMCLACTEILCTVPLALFFLVWNVNLRSPWISWADTHYNFSRVELYPATFWRNDRPLANAVEIDRWINIACAFTFFVFFGYTAETKKTYGGIFNAIAKRVGIHTTKKANQLAPIHFKTPLDDSHDSLDSFASTYGTASLPNLIINDHLIEKGGLDHNDSSIFSSIPATVYTPSRGADDIFGTPVAPADLDTPLCSQESYLPPASRNISTPQPVHIRPPSVTFDNPPTFGIPKVSPISSVHDIV